MINHCRGDNDGSVIAAMIHYHNRYVDAAAAIFNAAINFLPSRKWTIIKRDLMRAIVSRLVAQEIFCMKKIATLFIADCTDGTKEKRNLSPRIVSVKNTNSNFYMARYTLISLYLLNDYVPVLGVLE